MNQIYIVLIRAHTGLARIGRLVTGYPYTHIGVCLDPSLTDFVTYSRRFHNLPACAGFMHEKRDYYAFGSYQCFGAKVFRLSVGEDAYRRILRFIRQCETDPQQLFNLLSMATMPVLHGFPIYKAHNCMSFTAKVLELSGLFHMERPYYQYTIRDMDQLLEGTCIFEGKLRRKNSPGYAAYMQSFPLYRRIGSGIVLTGRLVGRMLTHKGGNGNA